MPRLVLLEGENYRSSFLLILRRYLYYDETILIVGTRPVPIKGSEPVKDIFY